MRLWSLHPRHLDRAGLVAAWREALLAQAVILSPGRGYSNHPQLRRFQQTEDPLAAIGDFLTAIVDDADARGYRFVREKILATGSRAELTVTTGQLAYEWSHLSEKLRRRSPDVWERWQGIHAPDPHPSFVVVDGPIAEWEKVTPEQSDRGSAL
ncbi:pyrimidine dimer DNA glycosylase/endonuclease V [Microbacterium sp. G2-8]|uniref:pyrimidine dimer DNA glycosylase/endonuclease V n=1 Tax=Microbacterium sp. G2-8 TaxID=2842454 RepID=UPI001C8A0335|nr:pyrimidine dimer DNA glycosylase/endonuclease V [Microbacterium sp. G2-8]